jgi:hypothetical protein
VRAAERRRHALAVDDEVGDTIGRFTPLKQPAG